MLKFRTLRPSGLRLSAYPSSLLFLAPFHTLRSWVHSFGYSGPHLSSVCHYHPSLLANDFGLLWALGICAAQRGTDPRERSGQTLEIDFFHLGRESQGPVYSECSLKEGRGTWVCMSSWLRRFSSLQGKFFPARREHSWGATQRGLLKWEPRVGSHLVQV